MNDGYYANNIFKFVSHDKATIEDHGFNGFNVDIQFLKSRTAPAGTVTKLVYDQNLGFDKARTMYNFLKDNGKIGGTRKNARYIQGFENIKFSEKDFRDEFMSKPEIRKAVLDTMYPILHDNMFRYNDEEMASKDELGIDMNVVDDIFSV